MRNGPCGGVTPEKKCYVDETRKCIWYSIYKRAQKKGQEETLLEVLPPLDWNKVGTETWGDVVETDKKSRNRKILWLTLSNDTAKKSQIWDSVFKAIRQPAWWQGDSEYHPPLYDEPASNLEKCLRDGQFVVATEVTPPAKFGTQDKLKRDIELVKPYVTAINFTDSSSANPKMSAVACCKVAADLDAEPVYSDCCHAILQGPVFNRV